MSEHPGPAFETVRYERGYGRDDLQGKLLFVEEYVIDDHARDLMRGAAACFVDHMPKPLDVDTFAQTISRIQVPQELSATRGPE